MRNPNYVAISRHGVYYFRWPVPKALRLDHRPTTIKVSLRTRDPKRAALLARCLTVAAEDFLMTGTVDAMTPREAKAVIKEHFSKLLQERKAKIAETDRLTGDEIECLRTTAAMANE